MIKYKHVISRSGRSMYFKNGKMVSLDQIPVDILPRLEDGVELQMGSPVEEAETVDDTIDNEVKLTKSEDRKTCIFCGEPSTRIRYINQQNAKLCDEDYNNNTTGEIAAQMNRVN